MSKEHKHWRIVQSVELNVSAKAVWDVVGGFFNIHLWHPDIALSEIPEDQTQVSALRRVLTFPGQPKTTEELLSLNNDNFEYSYKWYSGAWGEQVQDYRASIRVLDTFMDKCCIIQWSSTFYYTEDAVSEFYKRGFDELKKVFS